MARILNITVKPNSPKTKILEEAGNNLKIAVAAPASDNKANQELIKFLKKKFKKNIKIIRGLTSKKKLVIMS